MKRCSLCLANVPDDTEQCPRCGGSSFESNGNCAPLRRLTHFFTVSPFYVKSRPPLVENDELIEVSMEWKLFKARTQQNAPPIFLWDRDGYVTPSKPEAALHRVQAEDLARILTEAPKKIVKNIKKSLRDEWGQVDDEEEETLSLLNRIPVIFEPVPRLRDPSILENMDWATYVEKLVCPKEGKDPSLVAIHNTKLLRPLSLKYAPHSIEISNPGTGKTSFYSAGGIVIDKATSRSVLGYARSPNEVYVGTVNGTELPTAFDQLESQTSPELARYMFNLMETGRALVDAGGFRFSVETKSCFSYLGNPIARNAKVVEGFRALLDHLSSNPALGRRFAIILFQTDLKAIRGSDKMSLTEEEDWKRAFTLFRAVEEYAQPKLKALIRNPKVTEWLHKPIKGYRYTIKKATMELKDYNLASFFEAHTEAEHRIRGAALHAAAALLLDRIALEKTTVEEILAEAEDHLDYYVEINLESIANLAQMWDSLRVDQAKTYFENQSNYLREIVSAAIHFKRANPDTVKTLLTQIPYQPQNKESYPYLSKCVDRLKRRKRLDRLNEKLRDYFGFQIERNEDVFSIVYFETPRPPDDLSLIGDFSISQFSPFLNENRQTPSKTDVDTTKNSAWNPLAESPTMNKVDGKQISERLKKVRQGKKGVSVLSEKLRNPRNGEKTEPEKEDSENSNCGICNRPLPKNLANTTVENGVFVHMDCVDKQRRTEKK